MERFDIDISSNLDIDKSVSKEEYVDRVINLLKPILENVFRNEYPKQQIKPHRDRINFACPYCMDSMQSSYKKRANIILEGKHSGFYKCFNCGLFQRVDKFFEDYNIDLELDVINYISNNLGDFSSTVGGKYDISVLLDIDAIEKYAIDRQEIKSKFGLIEIKDSPVCSWLNKRLQYKYERFLYNPSKNYILILNITPSGKILGTQKRMFYGDNKYITFSTSKLRELLYGEKMSEGKISQEIDMMSQLFGIFQINFSLPVTIFEGAFDSFLFKNSIANSGVKTFPLDINVRYWYDYDKTGREKTLKILEEEKSVFLWEKFLKDIEAPFRKKWDLTDIKIWAKNNNVKLPLFDNYFSNDPFDMIDL